jgi:starch synthase (maltosyl-transferring)
LTALVRTRAAPPRESAIEHVVIEGIKPQLDGGRYPVKRLLGDVCPVSAGVFREGHGRVGARLAALAPGSASWSHLPLEYRYAPDHWFGELRCEQLGRWHYCIEAWPDPWGSWCAELRAHLAAGQDVEGELIEGAALLERLAARALGEARQLLLDVARSLRDPRLSRGERLLCALAQDLAEVAGGPLAPEELARSPEYPLVVDRRAAGFGAWYELFPRSQAPAPGRHGTFADVERRLPELAELGFDVVYLPPVHPIGRTGRKGPDNSPHAGPGDPGSPWAIGAAEGGHTALHPELGSFADFERLLARGKQLGLEFALDYALQCSPDHPWVREHPGWFEHRADGSIRCAQNPPKRYEDVFPLDFWCAEREALWNACRDVLLFWIECGVRIFRVDNPHTKPFAFWEWLIEIVQRAHPDVIFLAEAFTRPLRMYALAKLGFTQSYTYFTWKNSAAELRQYLGELARSERAEYFRPNFFANTPDILHEYLQRGGRPAFRVRLLLAATLSPLYGIYSGFELCEATPVRPGSEEYLHSEKYEIRARDWDASANLKSEVRALNRLRREHPALQQLTQLAFAASDNEALLCYYKWAGADALLAVVNLDPAHSQQGSVQIGAEAFGLPAGTPLELEDLLSGQRFVWHGRRNHVRLDPAVAPGHLLWVRNARAR